MAEAAEDIAIAPPKPPSRIVGTLVNGLGIFALTLGAVVAGGFVNAALHPLPELKLGADGKITVIKPVIVAGHAEEAAHPKSAIYFAIDPPLVVNFEDGSAVRFMQITMEAMARDQAAIDGVQKNVPLIRNNLLLLMGNRDYQVLMTREGKEQLRKEALAEVRAIEKKEGTPEIEDLLFTSFVVQ